MDSNFQKAIERLRPIEGGYNNDPSDLGGETKFGISKRQYPYLNIRELTPAQADEVYLRDYWMKFRINEIKDSALASQILDMCVNAGMDDAARCLQRAIKSLGVDVEVDGVMGSSTIKLANSVANPDTILDKFILERIRTYLKIIDLRPNQLNKLKSWIWRTMV